MLDQPQPHSPRLQTPPIPNYDVQAFPGENWFFYWKLGSGLWRSKLEEYTHPGPLLVPLSWSFHTETGDCFDFADHRPETNLKKLVDEAHQLGHTLSFLLPLTPVPYLPNGGVPHLIADSPALDSQGIAYGIVDGNDNINKLYSFFDTKVFRAYARFTKELGRYLVRSGIDTFVRGMECGYGDKDGFKSFLWDTSPAWKKSFDEFVRTHREDSPHAALTADQLRHKFYELIRQTYRQQAAKDMGVNWEGVIQVGFVGGHPPNIFERLEEKPSDDNPLQKTLETLTLSDLPSTVLVPPARKKGCWEKMLSDIVINGALNPFRPETDPPHWNNTLEPLRFFEIHRPSLWNELHLKDYLRKYYRWTYRESDEFPSHKEDDSECIRFIQGCDLTVQKFRQLVCLIMNGSHLILDETNLSQDCSRQLESFFLENDLKVEKINFHTNIRHIQLEHARLITFNGSHLGELPREKFEDFWHRLVSVFSLRHLPIQHASGIEHYWRTRLPSPEELNYEEIRRLSVYNADIVKGKVNIPLHSNFKLLRIIDQIGGNIQSSSRQITLELEPEGSLSLDFGVLP